MAKYFNVEIEYEDAPGIIYQVVMTSSQEIRHDGISPDDIHYYGITEKEIIDAIEHGTLIEGMYKILNYENKKPDSTSGGEAWRGYLSYFKR